MALMDRIRKAAGMKEAPSSEPPKPEAGQKKQELIDYLQSLPEVEDPYTPFEEDHVIDARQRSEAEKLACDIRLYTREEKLVSRTQLREACENADVLLEEMKGLSSCADILSVQGQKDVYYYCSTYMTDNYARIAMLVLEKDWPRTIAEMVRFNCKTYPCSTPYEYFMRPPYLLTKPQLMRALDQVLRNEAYKDIVSVEASNGAPYLYSTEYFTARYGKALADLGEDDSQ